MGQANIYREKFGLLIEKNKGLVYKVANSYCTDPEDRKDLVQEIIVQLWYAFPSYNDHFKLSTWIYRIALNVAISFYRKDKTRKTKTQPLTENMIEIADDADVETAESNLSILEKSISKLPELDKALIILYLDENSHKEIADILGLTETNVATRISRIKEKLKANFKLLNH